MSTWKATSSRDTLTIAVLASLLCLLMSALSCRQAGAQAPAMQDVDIRQAIGMAADERQRAILTDFINHFDESDTMRVSDHSDRYEIIVSHPSSKDMTGGAEQYFLDKETGKWAEHPMPF